MDATTIPPTRTTFDFFRPANIVSRPNFKWLGILVIIVVVVVLVFLFMARRSNVKKTEEEESKAPGQLNTAAAAVDPREDDNDYDINDTSSAYYRPIKAPEAIDGIVLSADEMASADIINYEKPIMQHMLHKVVKLELPVTNANFRLYGTLSPRGHIYFYNSSGECVVDLTFDNNIVTSNVSGVVKTVTLQQLAKSLHFVITSYVVYCNSTKIGELHGQHDLQYIRVEDQRVREIQLIDVESQSSAALLNIGEETIFN